MHIAQSLPSNIIFNQRQALCMSVYAAECRITRAACIFIMCEWDKGRQNVLTSIEQGAGESALRTRAVDHHV